MKLPIEQIKPDAKMEYLRFCIFTGLLSILMVISAGLIVYYTLKVEFDERIEKQFNRLDIGFKQTLLNCSRNDTQTEKFNQIFGNETISKMVTTENGTLCSGTQLHRYVSLVLGARIDILEIAIDKEGVKGEKGDPGTDGTFGIKGERGSQGETGAQGKPGIPGLKGDKGERGMTGRTGEKGIKGEQGQVGSKGEKGYIGSPGIPGRDGEPGIRGMSGMPGLPGLDGPRGKRGQKGAMGRKGEKGEGSFP